MTTESQLPVDPANFATQAPQPAKSDANASITPLPSSVQAAPLPSSVQDDEQPNALIYATSLCADMPRKQRKILKQYLIQLETAEELAKLEKQVTKQDEDNVPRYPSILPASQPVLLNTPSPTKDKPLLPMGSDSSSDTSSPHVPSLSGIPQQQPLHVGTSFTMPFDKPIAKLDKFIAGGQDANRFLENFSALTDHYADEKRRCTQFLALMSGAAASFANSQTHAIRSWPELKALFQKTYAFDYLRQLRAKLSATKFSSGDMATHIATLEAMYRELNPIHTPRYEEEFLHVLAESLPAEIGRELLIAPDRSLEESKTAAIRAYNYSQSHKKRVSFADEPIRVAVKGSKPQKRSPSPAHANVSEAAVATTIPEDKPEDSFLLRAIHDMQRTQLQMQTQMQHLLSKNAGSIHSEPMKKGPCPICNKPGHTALLCWHNPNGTNYRRGRAAKKDPEILPEATQNLNPPLGATPSQVTPQ